MKLLKALLCASTVLFTIADSAQAAPIAFTPSADKASVDIEALIPLKTFNNVTLPKGAVQLEDGILSVTIVPEWNFDRVPVLSGPIIRTEAGTTGRQGIISGVALFLEGYWFDKYWGAQARDTLVTASGTMLGRITAITAAGLAIIDNAGRATVVPLSEIKEIHSPRAYAFVIPASAATPISPDTAWTGDAQTIQFTPTAQGPSARLLASDSLLRGDGDWTTTQLVTLGTALSLVEIAQFIPELVLPLNSRHLYKLAERRSYEARLAPGLTPATAAPPPGAFPGL